MAHPLHTEPWRHTHARKMQKASEVRRLKPPPVFVPGVVPAVLVLDPAQWNRSDPRVAELLRYEPAFATADWAWTRNLVIAIVQITPRPEGRLRDRHWCGTIHRYLVWAKRRGYSLDLPSLFCGDRIDEFIHEVYSPESAQTHRYRLRHVATLLYPPPPERTFKRIPARPPHSPWDRDRFLAAVDDLIAGHHAASQVRQALYRDLRVVMALTFGAGCNGRIVHQVRQSWIEESDGRTWLRRPDRMAPTPVDEPWAAILRDALSGEPDAWLVRPQTPNGRGEQVGKILKRARTHVPAITGFDPDCAARRWHVDFLHTTGFDVLAAICGYRPGTQVPADLVPALPQPDTDRINETTRRWMQ